MGNLGRSKKNPFHRIRIPDWIILVPFAFLSLGGSSVEGSQANYTVNIVSLERLAKSDLQIVGSLMKRRDKLTGKESQLIKIYDK